MCICICVENFLTTWGDYVEADEVFPLPYSNIMKVSFPLNFAIFCYCIYRKIKTALYNAQIMVTSESLSKCK